MEYRKRQEVPPLILVINLDRDTQRMATVSRNLAALGLEFERLPAVMGKDLANPGSYVDAVGYAQLNRAEKPRAGEIGCYLSHIAAMRRLLATDSPCALILEDDVELLPEAKACLGALADRDDWDMVKIFCFHRGTPFRLAEVAHGRSLCVHLTRTTSTAAYLVNRKAAETLVSTLLPIREQIDHAHDRPWETGLRIRGLRPLVARLAETSQSSSIGATSGSATAKAAQPAKRSGWLFWRRAAKEIRRVIWALGEIARSKTC